MYFFGWMAYVRSTLRDQHSVWKFKLIHVNLWRSSKQLLVVSSYKCKLDTCQIQSPKSTLRDQHSFWNFKLMHVKSKVPNPPLETNTHSENLNWFMSTVGELIMSYLMLNSWRSSKQLLLVFSHKCINLIQMWCKPHRGTLNPKP